MKVAPFCLLLLFGPLTALAQETPDIVTDRPDQTESSEVVAPGSVQIETGALYERDEERRTLSYATTLVRIGIHDELEFRATGEYVHDRYRVADIDYVDQGIGNISVGGKVKFCDEEGIRPQIALIGSLLLPVGSQHFKPRDFAPGFRFTLAHSLGESASAGVNIGAEWDGDGGRGTSVYTATVGFDLWENWGAFAEVFGEMNPDYSPVHLFDAGVTFKLAPNLQFDASFAIPITKTGPDHFAGMGVSWRLPR